MVSLLFCTLGGVRAQSDSSGVHTLHAVDVYGRDVRRTLTSTAPHQQLSQGEMLRLGVTDIADALHRLSGVLLRDYGGAGGLKTVSVRGFGAQHTGVSYDGILLGESQGGEIDVSRYALDNLARIQLTVGDGDDIFVSARQAASVAVLSLQTLDVLPSDDRLHLTAQARVGSFGYVSPFVRLAQRVSPRLVLSASGEYVHADNGYPFTLTNGTLKTREHRTNSRMNSGHAEMALHWQTGQRSRMEAKVYCYDNDRQLPGIVRYYTNVCGEQLRERNAFAQVRWQTSSPDEKWLLRVQTKYNWAASCYQDTLKVDRKDDASYWQREAYVSATLMWLPSERWAVSYATDYLYHNLNSSLSTDRRPYRHGVLQSLTARYRAPRLTLTARLLASLYFNGVGLQVADTADAQAAGHARDMQRLSPSVSLSWRLLPLEELYLRASYKDIFRVPTFNESYYFHYGSTHLSAEKTRQFNLGLTWAHTWTPSLTTQFTADGYCGRVDDKIVAVPYNLFVWRTENLARVSLAGVDATLRARYDYRPGQSLELAATWGYLREANRTDAASANYGKQLAYTPQNSGSIALAWTHPWLCLSLHGTGVSARWPNNNHYEGTRLPGYWETGLTAYRTFRLGDNRQVELRGDVKNLFDRQYEVVAHYPMPGISCTLSAKYSF